MIVGSRYDALLNKAVGPHRSDSRPVSVLTRSLQAVLSGTLIEPLPERLATLVDRLR